LRLFSLAERWCPAHEPCTIRRARARVPLSAPPWKVFGAQPTRRSTPSASNATTRVLRLTPSCRARPASRACRLFGTRATKRPLSPPAPGARISGLGGGREPGRRRVQRLPDGILRRLPVGHASRQVREGRQESATILVGRRAHFDRVVLGSHRLTLQSPRAPGARRAARRLA
jgi:hypothetical protein